MLESLQAAACSVFVQGTDSIAPTARLTLIVAGTAAYLGLAVLVWGGLGAFFCHPALTALMIELFALSGASFSPAEI